MLITLTLALAIGIFAINALLGHKIIDSLLFSLAVAIGLVPELMPAIVTISLSQGARRMGKVQVIAKRLLSIEDFGNMNVLCSDKTGTLTEGKITLRDYWSPHEEKDPRILHYGLLCNSALVGDRITGNAMDVAIWDYAIKNNAQNHLKIYQRIDEVPFDYQRRMMSTVVKKDDELVPNSKRCSGISAPKMHRRGEDWEEGAHRLSSEDNRGQAVRAITSRLPHPRSCISESATSGILFVK